MINWNEFKEKVIAEADVPHKNDKWYRLSKFAEEYCELECANTYSAIKAELEDVLYTLALCSPFCDEFVYEQEVEMMDFPHEIMDLLKSINKKEDFEFCYNYFYNKLLHMDGINDRLESAYKRLICDTFIG